jgi:hypothetical protein
MTQDELRIEEMAQRILLATQERSEEWAKQAVQEVLEAHQSRLQQDHDAAERQALLTQGLQDAINHRIKKDMLDCAVEALQECGVFVKEEWLSVQRDVRVALERIPVSLTIHVPKGLPILDPIRSSVAIAGCSFVGVFLANQIQQQGSLPLLFSLFFSMLGGYGLLQLQKSQIHAPAGRKLRNKLYQALSLQTAATHDWLAAPREQVTQSLRQLGTTVALLVQYSALVQLHKKEDRQEETDILQHLFNTCIDGFAEVFYADDKRDPERALDACIKLTADLQKAGVSIETIERGTTYHQDLESSFHVSGRITEGDAVMMIFPSWRWKGRLLAKGTLKRTRG